MIHDSSMQHTTGQDQMDLCENKRTLSHVRVELSPHETLITHKVRTLPAPNLQNRLLSLTRRLYWKLVVANLR